MNIKKKLWDEHTLVLVLPDNDIELNYCALVHMEKILIEKSLKDCIIICDIKNELEVQELLKEMGLSHSCSLHKTKKMVKIIAFIKKRCDVMGNYILPNTFLVSIIYECAEYKEFLSWGMFDKEYLVWSRFLHRIYEHVPKMT